MAYGLISCPHVPFISPVTVVPKPPRRLFFPTLAPVVFVVGVGVGLPGFFRFAHSTSLHRMGSRQSVPRSPHHNF